MAMKRSTLMTKIQAIPARGKKTPANAKMVQKVIPYGMVPTATVPITGKTTKTPKQRSATERDAIMTLVDWCTLLTPRSTTRQKMLPEIIQNAIRPKRTHRNTSHDVTVLDSILK